MAVIQQAVALAIGGRNDDIFADFRTAQIPATAVNGAAVRILAASDVDDVFGDCFIGDRSVMERSEISDANRSPVDPDDELVPWEPARPLERIRMSLDNQNAAAAEVKVKLVIREL